MNKFEIMPQVVVYKNKFDSKELERFFNLLLKYEDDTSNIAEINPTESATKNYHGEAPVERSDGNPIHHWTKWYSYGTKTNISLNKNINNLDDEELKFIYYFRDKIYYQVLESFNDYKIDWQKTEDWPEYVESWEMHNPIADEPQRDKNVYMGIMEVLKHKIISKDKEFAIQFHTDTHGHRRIEPGLKQLVTFTIYLNDNYQGGEISFLNELEEEPKVITYKPKAGDITVFPSGNPYWHAALPVTDGVNKTFIRFFANYNYEGSTEWHKSIEKYGKENWMEIYNLKIPKILNSGFNDRQVVKEGNLPNPNITGYVINIKKENDLYIDGREL
jgi:hypothetical protein